MSVDWGSPALAETLGRTNVGIYVPQPEVEYWNALRARLHEVGQVAPAVATASMVVGTFHVSVVPLNRKTLEPVGDDQLTSLELVADWFSERPRDCAGVRTGARVDWTLVGLAVESWASWLRWLMPVIQTTDDYQDGNGSWAERKGLRPYGRPSYIPWSGPSEQGAGWISPVMAGSDMSYYQARQVLETRARSNDQGGWILLAVGRDDRGRVPKFTANRELVEGVSVLRDGAVVPVAAYRDGGWSAVLSGFPDGVGDSVAPAWFGSLLGAKY